MRILLLALIIGRVSANSSFQEIHSSPQKCYENCKTNYPMDKGDDDKCSACCTGCRFESIIGLVAVDKVVQRDGAQKACYESCEEAELGGYTAQCKEGCDQQLKEAEEELANFDIDVQFSEMRGMMNPLLDMFDSFFGGNDDFFGAPAIAGPQQPEKAVAQKEPVKPAKTQEVTLEQILKDMGILVSNDKEESQPSVDSIVPANGKKSKQLLVLRENDGKDSATENDYMGYLRNIWNTVQDRNTVQILLISSITACLFAILWLLCNSSNDPIVARQNKASNEEPPAYNVLYGVDEKKKFPILVVAGVEEQAPPLPEKVPEVPLGFSTQI